MARRRRRFDRDERRIDPKHSEIRGTLQIVGPLLIAIGIALMIFGATKMFGFGERTHRPSSPLGFRGFDERVSRRFESFDENRDRSLVGFGITALGMLCLGGGVALTRYAFLGRVARYAAAEIAPVARDTISVVAPAIGRGIADGIRAAREPPSEPAGSSCDSCGKVNDADARFCDECGAPLAESPICRSCGEENNAGARFCDSCGKRLS